MIKKFSEYISLKHLTETLVQFNNGARYGQVVFLAGGGGSGKGFAVKQFIDSSSFKVLNVDDYKDAFLKLHQLTGKYPEIANLQLNNPKDLDFLHRWIKEKGIAKAQVEFILNLCQDPSHLKNIMFDETGKSFDTYDNLPSLLNLGYKPTNIHICWVLTDYQQAVSNNISRGSKPGGRQVADEILYQAHLGAAKTMYSIIFQKQIPHGIDGSIFVILNNREQTTYYKDAQGNFVLDKDGNKIVQDFTYLQIKKPGKPIMSQSDIAGKLKSWIISHAPDHSFVV